MWEPKGRVWGSVFFLNGHLVFVLYLKTEYRDCKGNETRGYSSSYTTEQPVFTVSSQFSLAVGRDVQRARTA